MITYICHNKDEKTGKKLSCTNNKCETSVCSSCGGRADVTSEIFWCDECMVPMYEDICPIHGKKGRKLASDLRPVFPEERLLVEIVLGKPFCFLQDSVWNGTGNHYYVNGKKIQFSVKKLKEVDCEAVRKQYEELKDQNSYEFFDQMIQRFIQVNEIHYNKLVEDATAYIREAS